MGDNDYSLAVVGDVINLSYDLMTCDTIKFEFEYIKIIRGSPKKFYATMWSKIKEIGQVLKFYTDSETSQNPSYQFDLKVMSKTRLKITGNNMAQNNKLTNIQAFKFGTSAIPLTNQLLSSHDFNPPLGVGSHNLTWNPSVDQISIWSTEYGVSPHQNRVDYIPFMKNKEFTGYFGDFKMTDAGIKIISLPQGGQWKISRIDQLTHKQGLRGQRGIKGNPGQSIKGDKGDAFTYA